ncbi:hypothetical protein BU23DRAFT_283577 [Bimuria novae-zelandiae CBS 107.79]|uniref:Uncharacterized protein n=1 Tax=Bimuria novae-zelandiae CBS 107.79 TaxID=1447943 RepID=A0A6A5UUW3_9PLEO|nr:hypothetical protein BU23DRAFT_283577 [Bimuria novae-zelandiae CBS 107.79]
MSLCKRVGGRLGLWIRSSSGPTRILPSFLSSWPLLMMILRVSPSFLGAEKAMAISRVDALIVRSARRTTPRSRLREHRSLSILKKCDCGRTTREIRWEIKSLLGSCQERVRNMFIW